MNNWIGKLIVDEDGNLQSGEWKAGLKYAGPSLPYNYGGTVSRSFGAVTGWMMQKLHYIPALKPSEEQQKQNRQLLDRAVFDLSQRPDGQEALRRAAEHGITFVFDWATVRKVQASALYDKTTREFIFSPNTTRQKLAMAIMHEFKHMADAPYRFFYSSNETLISCIKTVRGQEASARLSEGVFAAGCEFQKPGDDPDTYRPKGYLKALSEKQPAIAEAVVAAKEDFIMDRLDVFAQKVFRAFYQQKKNLSYYDEGPIRSIMRWLPKTPSGFGLELKIRHDRDEYFKFAYETTLATHKETADRLPLGNNYFLRSAPYSLDDKEFSQVGGKLSVRLAYAKLKRKMNKVIADTNFHPNIEIQFEPISQSYPIIGKVCTQADKVLRPTHRLVEKIIIPFRFKPEQQRLTKNSTRASSQQLAHTVGPTAQTTANLVTASHP